MWVRIACRKCQWQYIWYFSSGTKWKLVALCDVIADLLKHYFAKGIGGIGLDLFNDDTCPSGDITRLTHENVLLHSLIKLLKPYDIVHNSIRSGVIQVMDCFECLTIKGPYMLILYYHMIDYLIFCGSGNGLKYQNQNNFDTSGAGFSLNWLTV